MLTTTISVVLILVGSALDSPECANFARQPPFRPVNYFLSSGVFFFAFGGHGVFPTIQHDMRQPKFFTRSSIVAFLGIKIKYFFRNSFIIFTYKI
jgi:solute carrier family 32 (vesicular inhibitory amino acid transporter)